MPLHANTLKSFYLFVFAEEKYLEFGRMAALVITTLRYILCGLVGH